MSACAQQTLGPVEQSYVIALRAGRCQPAIIRTYLQAGRLFADFCRSQGFPTELSAIMRHTFAPGSRRTMDSHRGQTWDSAGTGGVIPILCQAVEGPVCLTLLPH